MSDDEKSQQQEHQPEAEQLKASIDDVLKALLEKLEPDKSAQIQALLMTFDDDEKALFVQELSLDELPKGERLVLLLDDKCKSAWDRPRSTFPFEDPRLMDELTEEEAKKDKK